VDPTETPIRFTSELSVEQLPQLEDLLFFNENQAPYRRAVVESIEKFGEPQVRVDRGLLRVHTSLLGEVQALYVVEGDATPRPIGAAVYARTSADTVTVLHIGVHPDFVATGPQARQMVAVRLIRKVNAVAAAIKDVRQVVMPYGFGESVTIALPTRRPRQPLPPR